MEPTLDLPCGSTTAMQYIGRKPECTVLLLAHTGREGHMVHDEICVCGHPQSLQNLRLQRLASQSRHQENRPCLLSVQSIPKTQSCSRLEYGWAIRPVLVIPLEKDRISRGLGVSVEQSKQGGYFISYW